jgi:ABC-type transport system involved in cytochrome c biogenesis permease subunit
MPLLYETWAEVSQPGREAFARREAGQPYNEEVFERFIVFTNQFMRLALAADLGLAPPSGEGVDVKLSRWTNIGETLLETITTGQVNPVAMGYAELGAAYAEGDAERFDQALDSLHGYLDGLSPMGRVAFEEFFNTFRPFYQSILLYLLVFLLASIGWLRWPKELHRAALWLLVLAFLVHTYGLGARMWIQGRPPVTNLYSSAIFVGWAAVFLGVILEYLYRNGIGAFTASIVGAISLVIAHNLAMTGDTLEMMRAVLDSNFWLATHVVIVTAGYSAVFLAGALAVCYVLLGVLTRGLDSQTVRLLYRMVYGITCFGLLFSFVGTMLGGIWADQSWGRFWGWDPKENGALMIVLWGALMLHARWGGMIRERGFMLLAIMGNVITAWSWFGTNLLGVGLHSYGFTDSGFLWLVLFWASQLAIISLGALPMKHWKSHTSMGMRSV